MEYSYPTVFRNRRSEKESETKVIIDQLRRLDLGFNHTGLSSGSEFPGLLQEENKDSALRWVKEGLKNVGTSPIASVSST